MITKYIVEKTRKQSFIIRNHYTMTSKKDIQMQINEYNKFLDDLKLENINLKKNFLLAYLLKSCLNYK